MNWEDIKSTPRFELEGLLRGLNTYKTIHAYDGYSDKDISSMAKDKPEVRSSYGKSQELKQKYEMLTGQTANKKPLSFKDMLG